MAELSFGPRTFRQPIQPRIQEADNDGGFMGLGHHLAFLQGCVASRPIGGPADVPIVVDFPDRPAKMIAAVLPDYGPASLLKVQLVDLPKLPLGKLRPTEVVVEVHAASINPTDWKQRKGTLSQLCALSLPAVLGIDFSGRVVRGGEEAPLSEGDEVFGRQTLDRMRELNGSYAEYLIVDSADLYKKPTNSLGHVGKLINKRHKNNKSVMILGASGGVGTFAVQLAKSHFGCFVMASCSSKNAMLIKSLGADQVLDYNEPTFLQSVGLSKLDVILDCVGGDDYWQAFKGALKKDGVYVTTVGNKRYLADDSHVDYGSILQIKADYLLRQISNKLGVEENYHILTGSQILASDLPIIANMLEKGTLRVIVDRVFPLMDIHKAHELSETHHAVGKIVIQIRKPKEGEKSSVTPTINHKGFAMPTDMDEQMANIIAKAKGNADASVEQDMDTSPLAPARGVRRKSQGQEHEHRKHRGGHVTFDNYPPPAAPTPPGSDHTASILPISVSDFDMTPKAAGFPSGPGLRPDELLAVRPSPEKQPTRGPSLDASSPQDSPIQSQSFSRTIPNSPAMESGHDRMQAPDISAVSNARAHDSSPKKLSRQGSSGEWNSSSSSIDSGRGGHQYGAPGMYGKPNGEQVRDSGEGSSSMQRKASASDGAKRGHRAHDYDDDDDDSDDDARADPSSHGAAGLGEIRIPHGMNQGSAPRGQTPPQGMRSGGQSSAGWNGSSDHDVSSASVSRLSSASHERDTSSSGGKPRSHGLDSSSVASTPPPAPPQHPDTPVEDLAARLEALQREVSESALRVQKLKEPQSSGSVQHMPQSSQPASNRSATQSQHANGRQPKIRWGQDEVRDHFTEDKEEDEIDVSQGSDFDSDDDPEVVATKPGKEEEGMKMAEDLVGFRRNLQAQAAATDGVALGTGNLFNRPSPADLLRGLSKQPKQPANGVEREERIETKVSAPAIAARAPPAEMTRVADEVVAAAGPIQYEGLLRRKKEDHGRFEDPYKLVCVCRLQDNVLKLRLTHNGEVVGLEEAYDMCEWKLMPRQGKPDRFTLMRGVGASGGDSVLNLKADNKDLCNGWIEALQKAQEAARSASKKPAQAPPPQHKPLLDSRPAPAHTAAPTAAPAVSSPPIAANVSAASISSAAQQLRPVASPPAAAAPVQRQEQPAAIHASNVAAGAGFVGGKNLSAAAQMQQMMAARIQAIKEEDPDALPPPTRQFDDDERHSPIGIKPSLVSKPSVETRESSSGIDRRQHVESHSSIPRALETSPHQAARPHEPPSASFAELNSRNHGSNAHMLDRAPHAAASPPAAPPAVHQPAAAPISTGPPAGVGIVFKESKRNSTTALVVKALAAGGPAETSGLIQIGDILLKVDSKNVTSTEIASQLILGPRGTPITMTFKRFTQDKVEQFSVKLVRGAS